MAVTLHRSDEDRPRSWTRSLRAIGPVDGTNQLTDAIINPLTTVQGLIDAINAFTRFDSGDEIRNRAAIEACREAEMYGILTDAEVAAANTHAGLLAAINADVADDQEDLGFNDGADNYLGNYATESTI